jgi:hypothetical protein
MSKWEENWEARQILRCERDCLVVMPPLREGESERCQVECCYLFRKGHGGGNPNCNATETREGLGGREGKERVGGVRRDGEGF